MKPFQIIVSKNRIILAVAALVCSSLQAADQPTETPEQIVKRLADLGPGVHEAKTETNGTLKSVKVVGQARISTVLGKAKGMEIAQQRAKASAQQAYIEWLKLNAKSVSVHNDESIITLEGEGNAQKEQGKASEKHTNDFATEAAGIIRGLALVGKHVDAEGLNLTLVYVWSPARAAQAAQAAATNSEDRPTGTDGSKPSSKPADSPVKTKTTVAPDFDR